MSSLDVRSLCEAFQRTAAAHPDVVALRSLGGATRITQGEYSAPVRRLPAACTGLASATATPWR